MCDSVGPLQMTKRDFLRRCFVCAGGIALGLPRGGQSAEDLRATDFPQNTGTKIRGRKEALFFNKTSAGIYCQKCPHACFLAPGESGICRNRVNENGVLMSTAYGNPCAVHIDPIEKKPFYHFLPATQAYSIAAAGCNLRCLNCQNWQISQVSPEETINQDLSPEEVVEQCVRNDCASIAYTYSEPTSFYEYVLDTSRIARERKIRNVLKSNGYINDAPLRLLCKHLDAANIDVKGFSDDVYRRLSRATLAPVLHTLKVLHEEGVWLEITNLVIPTWSDNMDEIKRMCEWLCANRLAEVPLHFSRFVPLYKLTQLPLTPVSTLENARAIAMAAGLSFVYIGNVPDHAAESTVCPGCHKEIIERRGYRIASQHVIDGRCEYCKRMISGVWKSEK